MSSTRPELGWWMWGLVAFAVVVALSLAVTAPADVTLGIAEHQAAATAARVDEIHAQWHAGGVRPLAIFAMIGDLVFIAIYGWGSWIAGRSFLPMGGILRIIGAIVAASAVVFVLTDYTETLLQLVQLLRDQGADQSAGIAATARPVKVAAWIVTFFGVIAGWLIHRFAAPTA